MRIVQTGLWVAAGIQMAMVVANVYLPKKLRYRDGIAAAPRIIRQIFVVHAVYVVYVVGLFAVMTACFVGELASGQGLGRFLAAAICIFWLGRIPVQLFCYDPQLRQANRAGDVAMIVALCTLAAAYGAAAIGPRW